MNTTFDAKNKLVDFNRNNQLKVLFIRTTSQSDDGFVPPLGLLYLSAVIREKYPTVIIKIVDYAVDGYSPYSLAQMAKSFNPDIIGFSSMTHEFSTFRDLVSFIRKTCPDALYLSGGPLATYNYEEIFETCQIDFALRYEAEITLIQLIESFYEGVEPHLVDGIVYKKNGGLQVNPQQQFIENLDQLPIPAWDLIDIRRYSSISNWNGVQKEKVYAPVMTSRGCPYRCSYCHSMFGKKYRTRSSDHILKELRYLHDSFGVREIHFIDDVFNLLKERTQEICQKIIDSGMRLALAFPNGVRADIMTDEILDYLKRAGTYKINYAIETVTPRLQSEIKKYLNLEKTKKIIDTTSKQGIITFGFFMLGFPTETREEIQNTIDFAVNSKLDTAKFLKVTPYKGTELGENVVKNAPQLSGVGLKHFTFYDTESSASAEVSGADLQIFIKQAYGRFYKNPARVFRILRKYPSFWDAIKRLQVAYRFADQ